MRRCRSHFSYRHADACFYTGSHLFFATAARIRQISFSSGCVWQGRQQVLPMRCRVELEEPIHSTKVTIVTNRKILLGVLIASSSSVSFALDRVELIVVGSTIPAACTPEFSGGGVVDYGNIGVTTLSATEITPLEAKYF